MRDGGPITALRLMGISRARTPRSRCRSQVAMWEAPRSVAGCGPIRWALPSVSTALLVCGVRCAEQRLHSLREGQDNLGGDMATSPPADGMARSRTHGRRLVVPIAASPVQDDRSTSATLREPSRVHTACWPTSCMACLDQGLPPPVTQRLAWRTKQHDVWSGYDPVVAGRFSSG